MDRSDDEEMATQKPETTTLSFPRTMLSSRELSVTDVRVLNHDTKLITFLLPGGRDELSGIPASSAILTQHWPEKSFLPCLRPYTPIHDRSQLGILQLMVKRYYNGTASNYMHALRPGDILLARGPVPGYTWKPAESIRDVLFIAGGAGITPLYSLTRHVLADERDQTRIQLLWAVSNVKDLVLRDELERLQKRHPGRLRVVFVVSGETGAEGRGDVDSPLMGSGEQIFQPRRIDKDLLSKIVGKIDPRTFGDHKGTKVWLCGPPAMEEAIAGKKGALGELGLSKQTIHRF